MKKTSLLIILISCFVFPHNLLAWGTTGHRVIAEIAERNLDENTKKEIRELLDNQHLAYWANWADFIKADTTERWAGTNVWHYVNAPANLSKTEYIECLKNIKQESLYSQIPILEDIVRKKNNSKESRVEALIFLIHLMGDMHQPMHTGREEDLGGNRVKIQWFGRDTNLHSLWDTALVDFEKYSYTEYATVLDVTTNEQREGMQNGNLEDWLYDSHCIANNIYGTTQSGENLSFAYNYKVRSIVNSQLQKGGYRLAKILNDLF